MLIFHASNIIEPSTVESLILHKSVLPELQINTGIHFYRCVLSELQGSTNLPFKYTPHMCYHHSTSTKVSLRCSWAQFHRTELYKLDWYMKHKSLSLITVL